MSEILRSRVLVSHPGRQHSHQAAMALNRAGRLAGYWAGVPSNAEQSWWIPPPMRRRLVRYAPVDLPGALAGWLPVAVVLRRIGRALPGRAIEQMIDYLACRAFDRQVADRLGGTGARAVVACEISALETFRAARQLGMRTILDAASVHHAVQDRVCPPAEPEWLHRRIVRVKQGEIELADHIVTVSEMARAGYVEAGVPGERVHTVPLGADTQLFNPGEDAPTPDRREMTFLFAGATIFRKGIDLLLEAFDAVDRKLPGSARLVIVGQRGDAYDLLEGAMRGNIVARPAVAQGELPGIFRSADCFVLPSRHDSFGMAVVEAMACGLPAIVSDMVGAREAIEEGSSGWVVPAGSGRALAERMCWCVQNRSAVAAMRPRARAAAERYTWERYGTRLNDTMATILGEPH